jgi:hypothetical protein
MNNEFGAWSGDTAEARPSWLPSIDAYRTPAEDWRRLTSQAQPFWTTRAPMEDLGARLRARYSLAAPAMARFGANPTFAQFLQDYPSTTSGGTMPAYRAGAPPYDPEAAAYDPTIQASRSLAARAAEAGTAAVSPTGAYLAGATPGTPEWNRRAWLASQFAGSEQAQSENRLRVANLLALQRPEGGAYTGQMASAIRNAMSNLYQQRINQGAARESFLDWYVRQARPGQYPPTE